MKNTVSLPHLTIIALMAYSSGLIKQLSRMVEVNDSSVEPLATYWRLHRQFENAPGRKARKPINRSGADRELDRAFLHFKHRLLAEIYSDNAPRVAHANTLMRHLKKVGMNLYNRQYARETMAIDELLLRLSLNDTQPSLVALGLTDAIESLNARNRQMKQLTQQRQDMKEIPTPTALRRELEYAIRNAWGYVEAQTIINPSTGWEGVRSTIETMNRQLNSAEKRRLTFVHKRKAKKKAEAEKPL